MIFGVGVDVVEIARIEEAIGRHGERFAKRILATDEWAVYAAAAQPARLLAKRFAIKEAFGKATGLGMRPPAYFNDIGVTHLPSGAPQLQASPRLAAWMAERRLRAHLSVSDERHYAVAMVTLEQFESQT